MRGGAWWRSGHTGLAAVLRRVRRGGEAPGVAALLLSRRQLQGPIWAQPGPDLGFLLGAREMGRS
jgi:hypothetical protein